MTLLESTSISNTSDKSLPSGWSIVRFEQMAENVTDRVDNPAEAGVERYVGLEHLDPESLKIRRWGTPDEVEATKLRFKPGDIVFGKRRFYQRKLAVADFEGICSAHALVLRAREDVVVKEFLPFFMQSETFFERAMSISVGSLSPTINWKALAVQEFAIPPKEEQERIAEILWAIDETSQKYTSVFDSLSSIKLLAFETLILKYKQKGNYKFDSKLEDAIVDIVAGISPACSSEPAAENEYGVLKVNAVGDQDFFEQENKALLNSLQFNSELEVKAGFLLVTRANALRSGVGRACIVRETRPGLMLSDKTLRLVINEKKVLPSFLLQALRTKNCRSYIELSANGTEAKNISQEKLRKAPIPLPPLEIQQKIESFLEDYELALLKVKSHCEGLQSLKKKVLSSLLGR